jgi:hypothetical protein
MAAYAEEPDGQKRLQLRWNHHLNGHGGQVKVAPAARHEEYGLESDEERKFGGENIRRGGGRGCPKGMYIFEALAHVAVLFEKSVCCVHATVYCFILLRKGGHCSGEVKGCSAKANLCDLCVLIGPMHRFNIKL